MTDIDRVTGQPATAYTPPEDRMTPTDRATYERRLDSIRVAAERETRLRPQVTKAITHYNRGLLSLADLIVMLAEIDLDDPA